MIGKYRVARTIIHQSPYLSKKISDFIGIKQKIKLLSQYPDFYGPVLDYLGKMEGPILSAEHIEMS
jgi:hypothetical protein